MSAKTINVYAAFESAISGYSSSAVHREFEDAEELFQFIGNVTGAFVRNMVEGFFTCEALKGK